jgi:hypothetical protein
MRRGTRLSLKRTINKTLFPNPLKVCQVRYLHARMLLLYLKIFYCRNNKLLFHNVPITSDMPVNRTSKLRVDSMSDALSFAAESSD